MGNVRVGTCSWTDKTMIERYYPRDVSGAEGRLSYYAARFDTVEVDSTFYGLPQRAYAENWAARTPPGFIFHIKAYGLMTQHSVDERSLHPELREFGYQLTERGRVSHPDPGMVGEAFAIFVREVAPLRDARKMGGVLMQFPPYFTALGKRRMMENLGYIEYAREHLDGLPMFVEFRHPSWVSEKNRAQTLGFLADRSISYVGVDAPQFEEGSTMPPLTAATAPLGYVRMHGRNRDTFFKQVASAADRFDYLYAPEELAEWAGSIRELAAETERTYVMFNNCRYDYAPRNARELANILGDVVEQRVGGVRTGEPVTEPGAKSDEGAQQLGMEL